MAGTTAGMARNGDETETVALTAAGEWDVEIQTAQAEESGASGAPAASWRWPLSAAGSTASVAMARATSRCFHMFRKPFIDEP